MVPVNTLNINSPCVWVNVAVPTQTSGTYPIWLSNSQTGTTSCSTNCVSSTQYIKIPVYQDVYGNQYVDLEAYVTPEQYYQLARNRVDAYHAYTERERAQHEAELENYRRDEEERKQRRLAAANMSRELLLAHLTSAQRATFEKNNWFVVEGGKSKTRYRIRTTSYTGNIDVLAGKGEKVAAHLCCHCSGEIPLHDHHLSQKLALEWDEERFLSIANRTAA